MFRLVFIIVCTLVASVILLSVSGQMEGWEYLLLVPMPVIGVAGAWSAWRSMKKRRSLRIEETDGLRTYVWTDTDGRTRRSDRDPRPDWDREDLDA